MNFEAFWKGGGGDGISCGWCWVGSVLPKMRYIADGVGLV